MGFSRPPSVEIGRGARNAAVVWFWRFLSMILRLCVALTVIGCIAVALVYLRLTQGPIALPGIASLVVEQVNETTAEASLEINDLVLSLGDGIVPSGLQFLDVSVHSVEGETLFQAPKITASFLVRDVLIGQLRPIRVTLVNPTIEVVRDRSGNFAFGMAAGGAVPEGIVSEDPSESDRFEAFSDVVDALVGDTNRIAYFERLEKVQVLDADLTYSDHVAGRQWRAKDVGLRIDKHERGARGVLTLDDIAGATPGLSLRVLADRLRGTGETLMTLQFGRVAAKAFADQAPGLDWLELIDGNIEGRASAVLSQTGAVSDISGVLITEDGALDLNGEQFPYDFARLAFSVDPSGKTFEVRDFTATSNQIGVRMNAISELLFDQDGTFSGLALNAELDRVSVTLPDMFDDKLDFDAAGVTARWDQKSNEIKITSADLRADGTTYELSGRLIGEASQWLGDLRVTSNQTSMADVLRVWPVDAAIAARDWVDQNIIRAEIPELLMNVRLGRGTPQLAMDFQFESLDARYLGQMSPLRSVSGVGHLDLNSLHLQIDDGYVQPKGSGRIALGGSRVILSDFEADEPLADIKVDAKGNVQDVLTLIDQRPLGLIQKLGADLGRVAGEADLDVVLAFPLLADLALVDIEVSANVALSDIALNYHVPRIGKVQIQADTAALEADTTSMRIHGDVVLDGVPSTVAWSEVYGEAREGRTLELASIASVDLLDRIGIARSTLSGTFPFDLELSQDSGGPVLLKIDADLETSVVQIEPLGWRKDEGQSGRLRVDLKIDETTDIDAFRLITSDLSLAGSARLNSDASFRSGNLTRFALKDTFDLKATVQRIGSNRFSAEVSGAFLDITELQDRRNNVENDSDSEGPEVDAKIDISRLIGGDSISISDAQGALRRTQAGATSADIRGKLAGIAPISVRFSRPVTGAGQLQIDGANAGEVLRAMELYEDGTGGELSVSASIDEHADLAGILRIQNLGIGSETALQQVFRSGGFDGDETPVAPNGLSFRKIWVPFEMKDGTITLTDAIASSSALALKVNGSVHQASESLDLRGVISPAYGLTGALDNVPLLGTLLSGGEGEGILAMTFTLSGPSKDPDFALNPLSLLTPGILRSVFEGSGSGAEDLEAFRETIQKPER